MKYFTPDLIARVASRDDDVADVAHEEWERVIKEYKECLAKGWRKLPRSVQTFIEKVNLHDDRIVTVSKSKDDLSITLRHGQSEGGIELRYRLAAPLTITDNPVDRDQPMAWLYDEFEVGDKRTYRHMIWMAPGFEVQLPFTNFSWRILDSVVAPPSRHEFEHLVTCG